MHELKFNWIQPHLKGFDEIFILFFFPKKKKFFEMISNTLKPYTVDKLIVFILCEHSIQFRIEWKPFHDNFSLASKKKKMAAPIISLLFLLLLWASSKENGTIHVVAKWVEGFYHVHCVLCTLRANLVRWSINIR